MYFQADCLSSHSLFPVQVVCLWPRALQPLDEQVLHQHIHILALHCHLQSEDTCVKEGARGVRGDQRNMLVCCM